jgi:hypothetical protein
LTFADKCAGSGPCAADDREESPPEPAGALSSADELIIQHRLPDSGVLNRTLERTRQVRQTDHHFSRAQPPNSRLTNSPAPEWGLSGGTTLEEPVSILSKAPQTLSDSATPPAEPEVRTLEETACGKMTSIQRLQGEAQMKEARSSQRQREKNRSFGNISNMRMAVLETRIKANEVRTQLRREREALDTQDACFVQELRKVLAGSPNKDLEHILQLSDELQRSRDAFYPMEDDYNKLEERLDAEDFELQEAEMKVYMDLESARTSFVDNGDHPFGFQQKDVDLDQASVQDVGQDPAYNEYLSRVGDMGIVQERLQELRLERMHLVEEERVRARVGLPLDYDSIRFLETFDQRHEELRGQHAAMQEELNRMRGALATTSPVLFQSFQFNEEPYSASLGAGTVQQVLETPFVINSSDLGTASTSTPPSPRDILRAAQYPRSEPPDPLLLPDDDASPVFSTEDDTGRGVVSTVTFINEWLLNRLRRSTLEVWRFKSALDLEILDLDQNQLSDLVVQWWSKDEKAGGFLQRERAKAKSFSLTSGPFVEFQKTRKARSDSVLHTVERSAGQVRRVRSGGRRPDAVRLDFSKHANGLLQNEQLSTGLL